MSLFPVQQLLKLAMMAVATWALPPGPGGSASSKLSPEERLRIMKHKTNKRETKKKKKRKLAGEANREMLARMTETKVND
jgi:hypothetical protein